MKRINLALSLSLYLASAASAGAAVSSYSLAEDVLGSHGATAELLSRIRESRAVFRLAPAPDHALPAEGSVDADPLQARRLLPALGKRLREGEGDIAVIRVTLAERGNPYSGTSQAQLLRLNEPLLDTLFKPVAALGLERGRDGEVVFDYDIENFGFAPYFVADHQIHLELDGSSRDPQRRLRLDTPVDLNAGERVALGDSFRAFTRQELRGELLDARLEAVGEPVYDAETGFSFVTVQRAGE